MAEQQRVSTRVGREVIETIERMAEVERRPPSAVIRIALEDWAAARRAPDSRPEAA
jgi:predicted transcriptional regulator